METQDVSDNIINIRIADLARYDNIHYLLYGDFVLHRDDRFPDPGHLYITLYLLVEVGRGVGTLPPLSLSLATYGVSP